MMAVETKPIGHAKKEFYGLKCFTSVSFSNSQVQDLQNTLWWTNIAGWKIHYFDGDLPGKMGIFHGLC